MMKIKKFLIIQIIALILIIFLQGTAQKDIQKSFSTRKIMKNGFEYFTKFGVDIGTGGYKYRLKLRQPVTERIKEKLGKTNISMDFLIMIDTEYEEFHENMTCEDKYAKAVRKKSINIDQEGNWSKWYTGELTQSLRQHMWYFALGKCGEEAQILERYGMTVVAQIVLLNSDESQFSSEESGMITLYALTLLVSLGSFAYLVSKFLQMTDRDYPLILLLTAFFFLILHILFYFIHLTIYSSDGQGSIALQIMSSLSDILSQFVLTILLVLLSWGWTVRFNELQDLEVYIPLGVIVGVLQLIIMGLGYINVDADNKFHFYDGWVGILLIIIRLASFAYFVISITQSVGNAQGVMKSYCDNLKLWGAVYFLAIPFSVIMGSILATYLQHRFITIAILIFQMLAITFLSFNFVSKNSGYGKVAMKNRTELPSAFGTKFD